MIKKLKREIILIGGYRLKRSISLLMAFILSTNFLLEGCIRNNSKRTLKIFNWGEYISDGTDGTIDVIKEFEKETGINVVAYDTYDSNEQMYAKLKSGGADYDIIFPSDYMVSRLIDEDMLLKIDKDKLTNYNEINDEFKGDKREFDKSNEYSVPYTWGTVGLIYNKDLISKLMGDNSEYNVDGFDFLWNEKLDDNILMFINSRDSFAIAEKLLGYSLNTIDINEITRASNKLKEQKSLVQSYLMDEMFDKMLENEAAISPAYSGDIITMTKLNSNLSYCFPKEGSNLFVDCVSIPKSSKNYDNALKFIDFLSKPQIAKANCEFINYSTPNIGAYNLLDDEMKNNKIAYPDEDILNRCESFVNLPKEILSEMENLWIKIRK